MSEYDAGIRCDVCNCVVARIPRGLFKRHEIKRPYVSVPYNYFGADEWAMPVVVKGMYHVCSECYAQMIDYLINEIEARQKKEKERNEKDSVNNSEGN